MYLIFTFDVTTTRTHRPTILENITELQILDKKKIQRKEKKLETQAVLAKDGLNET